MPAYKPDPLLYTEISLDASEKVDLHRGEKVIKELQNRLVDNKSLDDIIVNTDDVMAHFEKIFPEVKQTNQTGDIVNEDFVLWEKEKNIIQIELDDENVDNEPKLDVYIGGPSSLVAAALHAQSGESTSNILYAHDGRRCSSNWKGSCSYFHIRDSVPVYYWPDNHGVHTIYSTVKHLLQKRLQLNKYMQDVATDPNWNKLRVNFIEGVLKEPSIIWLFLKNQYHALKDVGLHIKGTKLTTDRWNQTANATMLLASLTPAIFDTLDTKRPLVLQAEKTVGEPVYTFLGNKNEVREVEEVIGNLESIAGGDHLEHHFLTNDEISRRGYDAQHVKKAAIFPNDGMFPPYLDHELEEHVERHGGQVANNMQLKTILVKPDFENEDMAVSRIVWEDTNTGETKTTAVNTLYVSLGPSMKTMKANFGSLGTKSVLTYTNLMSQMMLASAASIVFMARVDMSKINDTELRCMRDHIDGHNKHIIRLAEKDVVFGEQRYKYFVFQATGGGKFPARYAHPETALNVFCANIVPILGLQRQGIEYDILQVRSCARGVTAQNALRLAAPASNMVMTYGIGGIGMSTMAGNGLLMKAVLGLRKKVCDGQLTSSQYKSMLQSSHFPGGILHWGRANPFAQNYAQFVDNVHNPKFLFNKLFSKRKALRIANGLLKSPFFKK